MTDDRHGLKRSPVRIQHGASPSLTYKRALEEMRAGAALMLQRDTSEGDVYYILTLGRVSHDTAARLQAHADVIVESAGLFPGIAQSWRVRDFVPATAAGAGPEKTPL